jgi:hypothetical protein
LPATGHIVPDLSHSHRTANGSPPTKRRMTMTYDLTNKVAVVTGGNSGIGLGIA